MLEYEIAAFRKNAEVCHDRAHYAADKATKAEWLDLTTQWHWLANQAAELSGALAEETLIQNRPPNLSAPDQ